MPSRARSSAPRGRDRVGYRHARAESLQPASCASASSDRARVPAAASRQREVLQGGAGELVRSAPSSCVADAAVRCRRLPLLWLFCLSQKQAVDEFSTPSSAR